MDWFTVYEIIGSKEYPEGTRTLAKNLGEGKFLINVKGQDAEIEDKHLRRAFLSNSDEGLKMPAGEGVKEEKAPPKYEKKIRGRK